MHESIVERWRIHAINLQVLQIWTELYNSAHGSRVNLHDTKIKLPKPGQAAKDVEESRAGDTRVGERELHELVATSDTREGRVSVYTVAAEPERVQHKLPQRGHICYH